MTYFSFSLTLWSSLHRWLHTWRLSGYHGAGISPLPPSDQTTSREKSEQSLQLSTAPREVWNITTRPLRTNSDGRPSRRCCSSSRSRAAAPAGACHPSRSTAPPLRSCRGVPMVLRAATAPRSGHTSSLTEMLRCAPSTAHPHQFSINYLHFCLRNHYTMTPHSVSLKLHSLLW